MTTPALSELETDATIELINQGFGRGADSLARMINDEVSITVPQIQMVEFSRLVDQFKLLSGAHPSIIFQQFSGDFNGNALLVVPQKGVHQLVEKFLTKLKRKPVTANMENDALLEMGNIVLSACFGQFGELLATEFDCAVPYYFHADTNDPSLDLQKASQGIPSNQSVMLLQLCFSIKSIAVDGCVGFIIAPQSIPVFQQKLKVYLKKLFS